MFTADRNRATIVGFIVYVIGGWLFALLYFAIFASIGMASWWLGAALGFLHGLFLLVCALPLFVHASAARVRARRPGERLSAWSLRASWDSIMDAGRR